MAEGEIKYSPFVGLLKTLKNVFVVLFPFLATMYINSWAQIIPEQYSLYGGMIAAALAYFLKNAYENKTK